MQRIADWLEKLGMSEYLQRFAENRIDLSVLPDLTDQDLEKLGVVLGEALRVLGHAERIEPLRNRLHRGPTRSRGAFKADVDLIAEHRKVDRLGQKRLSAALQRLALRVRIAVGSDHDDRHVGSRRPRLGQEFKPAHPRHIDVGED